MEMNIIHNEVKANSVLESQFSNTFTNQKKQTICLDIIEKVNAVGNTQRTIEGKMKNYVQGCHAKICRGSERSKGTRRGEGAGWGAAFTPITVCYRHGEDVKRLQLLCGNILWMIHRRGSIVPMDKQKARSKEHWASQKKVPCSTLRNNYPSNYIFD